MKETITCPRCGYKGKIQSDFRCPRCSYRFENILTCKGNCKKCSIKDIC